MSTHADTRITTQDEGSNAERVAVSELTTGDRVVLKHGTYTVAKVLNTGNSSIVVLDGLGIRDWANAKHVRVER